MHTIAQRFASMSRDDPASSLVMRSGTRADYEALAEFHYLRAKPVTATRVLVMEDSRVTVAERFRIRNPSPDPRIVAVLIESYPALGCALRDEATAGRYRGWRARGDAARLLNAEVRCISRVVVHPQWRGVGLAVKIVRHALATAQTPYLEALAAMGRVHPFFKLAGMREYQRWPLRRDQRLLDAMRFAGAEAWELASQKRMRGHLARSRMLRDELSRWAGRGRSVEAQLAAAREGLLCEPVYYLKAREG